MRIIAGELKGRRIRVLPGSAVRPTTDRVREALFNILAPRLVESRFLDLFAGTGVVGLEALSRGAGEVLFVEKDGRLAALLRHNLIRTGVAGRGHVRTGDVARVVEALGREGRQFDLVFADPPYTGDYACDTLERLSRHGVVSQGGWVMVETSRRLPPPAQVGALELWRRQRYGEALLSFYRLRVQEGSS